MIEKIKSYLGRLILHLLYNYSSLGEKLKNLEAQNANHFFNSSQGENVKLYAPYKIYNSDIGSYTYISNNAIIKNTKVGKFCSIGPNLVSGWGIHPTNGISTAPMFYSTHKQNGMTLSKEDKIVEMKPITIGNDVFIGMNVTILDGVTIGDGAVIGAGAVVSKDIPPYAVAVGNPIKILKYRFEAEQVETLRQIKWWDWPKERLPQVEDFLFNVAQFIDKYKSS